MGIKVLLWFISLMFPLDSVSWDDTVVGGLDFIAEYVLQAPFFLMALLRYVVPTLDNLYVTNIHSITQYDANVFQFYAIATVG